MFVARAAPNHGTFGINGIRVEAGATATDVGNVLCAGITGNNVTGAGNTTTADTDIRLRQRFGTTVKLPGYGGGGYVGGSACATP